MHSWVQLDCLWQIARPRRIGNGVWWMVAPLALLSLFLWGGRGAVAQPGPMPWPAMAMPMPMPARSAQVQAPSEPVSYVQVPVELDLTALFASADELLPRQAGHWPQWRDWHGIETRYRAWRGPLRLGMRGEVVEARAHVRYQLQARKNLIAGLGASVGCGVDEPPRQALIGVLARLDWTPDWMLKPSFRVLPTRFLDGCEVTVASIDVSPIVGRVFEDRMESSLRKAMRGIGPRLQRMRADAGKAWVGLQRPRELTPGLWLHVQPLALALAPPRGDGARVQSAVWLAFRAGLSGDERAAGPPAPLPPLIPYRPAQPGLHLGLALDLDYGMVSAALSERLAGKPLELDGRRATLDSVSLSPRDASLVVTAELGGDLGGRLEITARPRFDPDSQAIALHDVSFVFDADDMDLEVLARIFYDRIRDHIADAANALLAERMAGARSALAEGLAGALPEALAADLSGLRVADLAIQVGQSGLTLNGSAEGVLVLGQSRP